MALGAILAALLLTALDQNVVGIVLPRIVGELGDVHLYAWVMSSYLLTSTVTVPIAGKLGDMRGRKVALLAGIVILVLGATLAAFAQSMTVIVITRALQGVGAGFLQASAFAAIGDLLSPAERGRYMGLFTGVFALATMVGPLVGGLVADLLGWRSVFLLDIPLGLIAAIAVVRGLPSDKPHTGLSSFDWAGTAAFIATIVPAMMVMPSGKPDAGGMLAPLRIPLFLLAATMFVLFVTIERRASEPIVPPHLFRRPVFPVAIAVMFLSGGGLYAAGTFMPLFLQDVLGKTATQSGLTFVPMMLTLVFGNIVGGQWISRKGTYRWLSVLGLVIASAGLFALSRFDVNTPVWSIMLRLAFFGLGMGVTMPMLSIASQNAVEQRYLGVATSLGQFARTLAGSLGIATFGAILAARLSEGLVVALSTVFVAASVLMALAAFVALFLGEIPLRRTNAEHHDGAPSSP